MEFFEKIKSKFKEKQDKKIYVIFILVCIGILMVCVSDIINFTFENKNEENINLNENISVLESKIEERLEEEISKISGAGKTSVMITLDSSKEYFYAQNSSEEIDETEVKKDMELVITEGENGDVIGEAVSDTNANVGTGYFATARLNRQQARDNALELLQQAAAAEHS